MTAEKFDFEHLSAGALFPDLFLDDVFTLETRRLFLRWPKASDGAAIVQLAEDARISHDHGLLAHPSRRQDAEAFVAEARGANAGGNGLQLAMTRQGAPERLIGCLGLHRRDDEASLSYWLGAEYRGQGYVREAVAALLEAVFLYAGLAAVSAEARPDNLASRKVLCRCGFQAVGVGKPELQAQAVEGYRLTRPQWFACRAERMPRLLAGG